jgi:hypothetical protein
MDLLAQNPHKRGRIKVQFMMRYLTGKCIFKNVGMGIFMNYKHWEKTVQFIGARDTILIPSS